MFVAKAKHRPKGYLERLWALIILSVLFSPSTASAETLRFTCQWLNSEPVDILIDIDAGTATRSDKGSNYTVVKLTEHAVWLAVLEQENQMGLAIQMIQRPEYLGQQSGKWIDIVSYASGAVSPIIGGTCSEVKAEGGRV